MSGHKDAPAFDFFPERFWFAVEGWTDREIVAYFRLLSQQWLRDGLPENLKEIRALARGKISEKVLEKFPLAEDGKRRNRFLEEIREKQRKRIERKRLGAKKTNAKRWGKGIESESLSDVENDRLASRLATIKRVDIESPPLTTHHSPLIIQQQQLQQQAREASPSSAPTFEQAQAYAEQFTRPNSQGLLITAEILANWHDDRSRKGWIYVRDGFEFPIADWRADLRAYARSWMRNNGPKGQDSGSGVKRATGPFKAQETPYQLNQRIEAAEEQLRRLQKRSYQSAEDANKAKEEIERLKANIEAWKKQILQLT